MPPDGLITEDIANELTGLAAVVPPYEAIVEIGSYKGMSATALGVGAQQGGAHVYCVDPWDLKGNRTGRFGFADPSTREAFNARIAGNGLDDVVTAIQGFSVEVASSWCGMPIGLLFIDGDHQKQSVLDDFRAWQGWLSGGAVVVFDDYVSESGWSRGVAQAVAELGLDVELVAGRLGVLRYDQAGSVE